LLLNYFDRSQISINLPVGAKDFGDLNLSDKNKIQEWYKTT